MEKTFFICKKCGQKVSLEAIGTKNRNHCPYCLWSLHVDSQTPGDRVSLCQGLMQPVGLTFKKDIIDKYGNIKKGELMIVHLCQTCGKETKNRIAGDDNPETILEIFNNHVQFNTRPCNELDGIQLLGEENRKELIKQLFGK